MNAPKLKMSAAEYLAFERGDEERHQFVDGEIFAMAGESLAHSTINANVIMSLGIQLRGKPCRVLSPNMKIRSGPAEGRSSKGMFSYADATVVCGEPRFHDEHQDVLINPKFIIEILSPSTEGFDRGDKFLRYAAYLESFTDYLLISSTTPRLEYFSRETTNRWIYTHVEGMESEFEIPSLSCRLALSDIYDRVVFA
jgi:Uma2 family endonuclease